jgi:predicted acylesterase/phospholipase RssA
MSLISLPLSGRRVLCLDGGGIRGLSMILILEELMLCIRAMNNLSFTPEPWQCFDFICGTSTGGLIAILLGRCGKTLAECKALFRTSGGDIFQGNKVTQAVRLLGSGSRHGKDGLRRVIAEIVGEGKLLSETLPAPPTHIPVRLYCACSHLSSTDVLLGCSCCGGQNYGDPYAFPLLWHSSGNGKWRDYLRCLLGYFGGFNVFP